MAFHSTSNEGIWPKKLEGLKSAILANFQSGLGWPCPVSTGHQESLEGIQKNLFVLGFYEFLERLEGKTGEGPIFFKIQSCKITVCRGAKYYLSSKY